MRQRVAVFVLSLALAATAAAQYGHPLAGTWSGDWGPDATTRTRVLLHLEWNGKAIVGSINLAPGSFDDRRELAIEFGDDDIIDRLQKTAHHDWKHSHPMDLSDEGLFADLEEHGGGAEKLVLRADHEHAKKHPQQEAN